MKILIVDEFKSLGNAIELYIKNVYSNIDCSLVYDIKLAKNLFSSEKYDILVINFGAFNNIKFVDYILSKNKMQKIVIISLDSKCTDTISCEHCLSNYKKIRLIPPFDNYDIIDKIINLNDSVCPHFKHCEKFDFTP